MSDLSVTQALDALKNDRFSEALEHMQAYGRKNTYELRHFLIRGLAELALKNWPSAAATFSEAVEKYPNQPQLWFNLGVAEENLKQFPQAAQSLERCLRLKSDHAEACGNLSNIYRALGKLADAEIMAQRAIVHGAPKAGALNNLGLALGGQGKFDEAEKAFRKSLQIEPDNPHILANLANSMADRLDFSAAWPIYREARAIEDLPVIRHHEGMARLLAGDFAQGWPLYEARLDVPGALRLHPPSPLWRGQSLAGKKLLLIAEQGFGDTIQFCRYGTLLAACGGETFWAVQKPLLPLLTAQLPGTVLAETDALPAADYYLPLLSLPLALNKFHPEDAPGAPYLRAKAGPKLPEQGTDGRKIGLVWSGSQSYGRDYERSLPLASFAPLWAQNALQFYAPFIGAGLDQIQDKPITRLDHLITNFADTAALLAQLDELVTVDTAVAHLAGALGVKTHLLLPYCPDWRWGTQGTKTPWYPSLIVRRQPRFGDWHSVITRLAEELMRT